MSRTAVDWRSGRAAALGLRWDRADAQNRAKYGQHCGGGCDDEAEPWGDPSDGESDD